MADLTTSDDALREFLQASETLFNLMTEHPCSREEWEREGLGADTYKTPEHLALNAAVAAMKAGAMVPPWAARSVVSSMERFDTFQAASLEEAFGVPPHVHVKAKRRKLLCGAISAYVDHVRAAHKSKTGCDLPLNDSSKDAGAFTMAAQHFGVSGKTVELMRTQWLSLQKKNGQSIPAPGLANAHEIIFSVISSAIRPQPKRDEK